MAVEYRWLNHNYRFDVREAYLNWYPNWGEVKIGKQIHAWGAVDGNNPTDNLNPYDFYFMFLPGTDRKIGTISAFVKYYWHDWQIEAVVNPEHEGNRLPFNEPDFPLAQSTNQSDPRDYLEKVTDSPEFGFVLKTSLGNSDLGISYFNGRDRNFTMGGYIINMVNGNSIPSPRFVYRKTEVIGLNLVTFINDLTFRAEGGFFTTENDYSFFLKNEMKASYIQYAIQTEYTTGNDFILSGQMIGSNVLDLYGTVYIEGNPISVEITEDEFQQGMGTPFAMFTDLGLMIAVSKNYLDNALELKLNSFVDLNEEQKMFGCGLSYSPFDNIKLEFSLSLFNGGQGTKFNEMEDFSHLSSGLVFSF